VKQAIESGVDKNRVITENALNKSCPVCVQTLQIWISLYGAEAGNLALKTLPTGGLYVAGGIAAKVMWAIFGALVSTTCNRTLDFRYKRCKLTLQSDRLDFVRLVLHRGEPILQELP